MAEQVPAGTALVIAEPGPCQPWEPRIGEETQGLLSRLPIPDPDDRRELLEEAVAIIRRCVRPRRYDKSATGLAMGYVQSGKTSSFTVVAALAKDNDFALVVVIAGTSLPLFNQSDRRLIRDLQLSERPDRAWMHISNPTQADAPRVRASLKDWRDHEDNRQVILMTVMKNHNHLRDLNQLLAALDLDGVAALIIDDEADQASLNTRVRARQESTTYRAILQMRRTLPQHTFLQYTATPQAPLLISLIDVLSPSFAQILSPGKGYTGGKHFLIDHPEVVHVIPPLQLPTPANNLTEPPDTLLEALRLYYLGVAAAYVEAKGQPQTGNRSMLIHPSQGVLPHSDYKRWVTEIQELWVKVLEQSSDDPDRVELITGFRPAYQELSKSIQGLPTFQELEVTLAKAIRRTEVTLMNATPKDGTPAVPWKDTYAHILIGGQAMDRSFTVEGLTVTYMPRSTGVGNVDTIQQRARFFGYKADYFGYCRVFLEGGAHNALRSYIEHEESVRKELLRNDKEPLQEWKRAFLLDSKYSPTRRNVLGIEYLQDDYSDRWFKAVAPHRDSEAVRWNQAVVDKFVARVSDWREDDGHAQRTPPQRHLVARFDLRGVLADLLSQVRMVDVNDSVRFTGLLLQISTFLEENPTEDAYLFHMSKGAPRERSLKPNDELDNYHQGRNPLNGPVIYPGDDKIRIDQHLSVQIHNLVINHQPAPVLSVWLPARMSRGWLVAK